MPKTAPTIRFSHTYRKLLDACAGTSTAQLIAVIPVNLEALHPSFIAYDTDDGKYELPNKGAYLLLLFRSRRGIFPTLRRDYPSKRSYYESKLGQRFEVVVTDVLPPAYEVPPSPSITQ